MPKARNDCYKHASTSGNESWDYSAFIYLLKDAIAYIMPWEFFTKPYSFLGHGCFHGFTVTMVWRILGVYRAHTNISLLLTRYFYLQILNPNIAKTTDKSPLSCRTTSDIELKGLIFGQQVWCAIFKEPTQPAVRIPSVFWLLTRDDTIFFIKTTFLFRYYQPDEN